MIFGNCQNGVSREKLVHKKSKIFRLEKDMDINEGAFESLDPGASFGPYDASRRRVAPHIHRPEIRPRNKIFIKNSSIRPDFRPVYMRRYTSPDNAIGTKRCA